MAVIPARIQVKRGPLSQLDKSMLLPGEFAVPTDSDCIYICIRAGVVLEIPSRENLSGILDKISEQSVSMQDILDSFEKLEIAKCNVDDSGVSVLTTYSSSKIEELFDNYYTKAEADVRYGPSTLVSDAYSNQNTYSVGEYCIYNNVLYKCKIAITNAEEFNAEHWGATSVSNEIVAVSNDVDSLESETSNLQTNLNKLSDKAITTDNIKSQSVNYATSAGSATSATKDASGNIISSTYLKMNSIARTDIANLYSTTYYTSMGVQYYIQYGKLVFVHLCFNVNLAVAVGSHICQLTKLTSNLMEASNIATISPNTHNVYTYAAQGGTKWINTNMAIPKDTIINIDVILALV